MSGPIKGVDGKRYPGLWLSPDDRLALTQIVHRLHCVERLSVRRLLDRIEEDHGIRRSVGWAAGILKTLQCDHCSGAPSCSPEQSGEVVA